MAEGVDADACLDQLIATQLGQSDFKHQAGNGPGDRIGLPPHAGQRREDQGGRALLRPREAQEDETDEHRVDEDAHEDLRISE